MVRSSFPLWQGDDFQPALAPESGRSQLKPGWKETTLYSLHRGDGNPPLTKVFTKSGEGRHPLLGSQDPGRNELPSKQLHRLLAPVGEEAWPAGKLRYLNSIHPASRLESRPIPDKVLFRSGSNGPAPRQPLRIGEGKMPLALRVLLRSAL